MNLWSLTKLVLHALSWLKTRNKPISKTGKSDSAAPEQAMGQSSRAVTLTRFGGKERCGLELAGCFIILSCYSSIVCCKSCVCWLQ